MSNKWCFMIDIRYSDRTESKDKISKVAFHCFLNRLTELLIIAFRIVKL